MAPQVGLEPTTLRLTAECSAIELLRNIVVGETISEFLLPCFSDLESGDDLPSRAVSSQVLSACGGLTSVFGMGTGGSLQPLSPEILCSFYGFSISRFTVLVFRLTFGLKSYDFTIYRLTVLPLTVLRLSIHRLPHLENYTGKADLELSTYLLSYFCTLLYSVLLCTLYSSLVSFLFCNLFRSSPRPISISTLRMLPHFHV